MIPVLSSVDRRIAFFLLYLSLFIMDEPANALSTTNDVPTTNTSTRASTRANTRTHRHHQSFKGQNFDLWDMVITTDKLRATTYNKLAKKTAGLVNNLCAG